MRSLTFFLWLKTRKNSNSNKYNVKCNYSSGLLFNVSVVYPRYSVSNTNTVARQYNKIENLVAIPSYTHNYHEDATKAIYDPNKKGKLFPCITNAVINQLWLLLKRKRDGELDVDKCKWMRYRCNQNEHFSQMEELEQRLSGCANAFSCFCFIFMTILMFFMLFIHHSSNYYLGHMLCFMRISCRFETEWK